MTRPIIAVYTQADLTETTDIIRKVLDRVCKKLEISDKHQLVTYPDLDTRRLGKVFNIIQVPTPTRGQFLETLSRLCDFTSKEAGCSVFVIDSKTYLTSYSFLGYRSAYLIRFDPDLNMSVVKPFNKRCYPREVVKDIARIFKGHF